MEPTPKKRLLVKPNGKIVDKTLPPEPKMVNGVLVTGLSVGQQNRNEKRLVKKGVIEHFSLDDLRRKWR
jgi:hypothetical protein